MSSNTKILTTSGKTIHPIGIGTWGFGDYPASAPGSIGQISAIKTALDAGQNHIDTAEMYAGGGAERIVGQAIRSHDRRDLYIASKLWKDHVSKGTVRPAVMAILERLGTNYLDLLYIHAPWFDAPWAEAIPQIEQLIDEGIVRQLGVSNFNVQNLQKALAIATQPIVANQMHYSLTHRQEVGPELRQLCEQSNIAI